MIETAIRSFVRVHHAAPNLLSGAVLLLSPAVGGLITGYLLHAVAPDAKRGVPEVIDALLHEDGFIRTRVGFIKALASARAGQSPSNSASAPSPPEAGVSLSLCSTRRITSSGRAVSPRHGGPRRAA
ncbi:MAG TPA: hypothetical protein VGM37_09740 [Armatimonadota bacterium]|jgi:hypothetical protein